MGKPSVCYQSRWSKFLLAVSISIQLVLQQLWWLKLLEFVLVLVLGFQLP